MKKVYPILLSALIGSALTEVRAQSPGHFNQGFGNNGMAWMDNIGNNDQYASTIDIQTDGKILVAGRQKNNLNEYDMFVWRAHTDGTFDYSFGNLGRYEFDMSSYDEARGVVALANGKIVVVGHINTANNGKDIVLHGLNADGTANMSFGNNGVVQLDPSVGDDDYPVDAVLTPNGKILVGGYMQASGKTYFIVYRFNPDGSLDNSYSGDGMQYMDMGFPGLATDLELASDGSVYVSGVVSQNNKYRLALMKLNPNGYPDNSFSGTGIKIFDPGIGKQGILYGITALPGGGVFGVGLQQDMNSSAIDAMLVQLTPTGLLDPVLNGNGVMTYDISIGGNETLFKVKRLANGQLLAMGEFQQVSGYNGILILFNSNGSIDMNYGPDGTGYTVLDLAPGRDYFYGMAMNNSLVYTAGYGNSGTNNDVIVSSTYIFNNVGLNEDQLNPDQVNVFPNPISSTETLKVQLGNEVDGKVELAIFDITGRKIHQEGFFKASSDYEHQINIRGLAHGVYTLQVINRGKVGTQKLIIK
ncbi:MAG: T9SS type A sorting domain-containing protein [Bacteroidota bacterium]|nr:T9SS type A sorting domain-containing protein [Bacteroidota bacterium]